MWYSRRAMLLAPLVLAACGFTPVYGTGGSATGLQGAIRVAEPDTREGFAFVAQMERRLGRVSRPRFELVYEITTDQTGLAITGSNDITRFNVEGQIAYKVMPVGSKTPVSEGSVRNFTAYSASGSTISTLTSERDALERLMVILANQIVTKLLVDPALQ